MSGAKLNVRYALTFVGALVAAVYLHEIGHAVVGWINGIPVVPTPAKEYVLRSQLPWSKEMWIALGGILGTTAAALTAAVYFWRKPCAQREAVLAGSFLPLVFYSLRYALVGRGHDALEWQAAQSALGLPATGHAVDLFFLFLLIAGLALWCYRGRPPLRAWPKLLLLAVAGAAILVAVQVGNNALFDRAFPHSQTVDVPSGLDPR